MTQTKVIGAVQAVDGKGVVRVESVYDTDVDDLWTAVTDPARLARWIAEVSGDLRPGGAFRARFTSSWEGEGRVAVCERPHHLRVDMTDGETATVIEAVLEPVDGGTRLVVTDSGIALGEVHFHGAGWQAHLEDLDAHVAGREPGDWRARWTELMPQYEPVTG